MNSIKEFYVSNEWATCRAAYKKYRGGLCERCLKRGIVRAGVDVHHKVRLTNVNINVPEIALSWSNLELLCRECHAAEHSGRRYTVDALGRVTPIE